MIGRNVGISCNLCISSSSCTSVACLTTTISRARLFLRACRLSCRRCSIDFLLSALRWVFADAFGESPIGRSTVYDMYGSSESEQILVPGELLPLAGSSLLLEGSDILGTAMVCPLLTGGALWACFFGGTEDCSEPMVAVYFEEDTSNIIKLQTGG